MIDDNRIMKRASKMVDAALKLSTMTKEIPGNMEAAFSQDGYHLLNEEVDPEIISVLEYLMTKDMVDQEKSAAIKLANPLIGASIGAGLGGLYTGAKHLYNNRNGQ